MRIALLLTVFVVFYSSWAVGAANYSLRYQFRFLPEQEAVDVQVRIPSRSWLRRAEFDLTGYDISNVEANGELQRTAESMTWLPPAEDAKLSYRVDINNERSGGGFDAYINSQWALLRGEDLIPPVRIRKLKGAEVAVSMQFLLPKGWSSVNTGWPREADNVFFIDNPDYTFSRPAGWIVAGSLGTRHEQLDKTQFSISAPQGHNFRQMEMLSFIGMVWPHLANAVEADIEKILITGAGEPMWRGGLSGPNSLFMHTDRPLVSENGTSTLIHELFHVVGGIDSSQQHDWIIEGLAEFYSVEVIYRAGGYTAERRGEVFAGLQKWSDDVQSLLGTQSQGAVTARAAVLFDQLHHEIITATNTKYCLDDLLNKIQDRRTLTPKDLRQAYRKLVGEESQVLRSLLLKPQKP